MCPDVRVRQPRDWRTHVLATDVNRHYGVSGAFADSARLRFPEHASTDQPVQRESTRAARKQYKQHGRPLNVGGPRLRVHEDFDDRGHAQQHSGCRTRQQTEYKQYRS